MPIKFQNDRRALLAIVIALGLSACSDDGPTGTGNQGSGLALFPEDGAVLTQDFELAIGTDEVDSMVVYLDGIRLATVAAPPFTWPLQLIDYTVGEHMLAVTVFARGLQYEFSSEVLMCRGLGVKVGNFAPFFSMVDLDGNIHALNDSYRTKVTLLDFWATWCPPCIAVLPETQRLYEEYGDRGLKVLTVDDEERDVLLPFLEENGYTFPVLRDTNNWLFHLYDGYAIPMYYVIDHRGIVRYVRVGTGGTPLEDVIKPLLQ